jgi:GDP-L-fucose synthase
MTMTKNDKIFVAGGTGMVGSAILRRLISAGYGNIISNYHHRKPFVEYEASVSFQPLDLTNQAETDMFFRRERPDYVFLAAAKVGGILANQNYPADFIFKNLMIETNVIHCAYIHKATKLLFLGSSCIYPKFAPQPMKEEYLLTGKLESTNEPYAVAKIAGIILCQSYNRQYGANFISVMPTNLYGPLDNFDLERSHVVPALLRKFHEAKESGARSSLDRQGKPKVIVWGSGLPRRELLHVDDLADACVFLMQNYDKSGMINIGTGMEITIKELAEMIRRIVQFEGDIIWDSTKPDGTPQKLLDITKLNRLGWKPNIWLEEGIRGTYEWYLSTLKTSPFQNP